MKSHLASALAASDLGGADLGDREDGEDWS